MNGNVISIVVGGVLALLAVGAIEHVSSAPEGSLSHGQRIQIARAAELQAELRGSDPAAYARAIAAATGR